MRFLSFILFIFTMLNAHAYESFSYSGRLVNNNGSPVTGYAKLTFELAYSSNVGAILCTQSIDNVSLSNGVFHVGLQFPSCNLVEVIKNTPAGQTLSIRVIDRTQATEKSYSFQAIHSLPYSFMSQTSKQLDQMGATSGQVLSWEGGEWKPKTIMTEIADGSITDNMLVGNIPRTKLAPGVANQIVVNDGSGNLSSVSLVPILMGGTGATDAAGARANLGAMAFSDVPTCLDHQKLKMNPGPVFWSCPDDLTEDSSKLPLIGGTLTGPLLLAADPSTGLEAATKAYVDSQVSGVNSSQWTTISPSEISYTGSAAVSGAIKFKPNTFNVELKASSSTSENLQFVLPPSKGSAGLALVTDGNGNLSWAAPAAADSSVIGGELSGTVSNATINNNTISSSKIIDNTIVDDDISPAAGIAQSKIAGLQTDLGNKEPTLSVGTTDQYYRGDKTWQNFDSAARGAKLSGYVKIPGNVSDGDSIQTALGKIDDSFGRYVLRDGSSVITSDFTLSNKKIINLADPTLAQDAATKSYVDTKVGDAVSGITNLDATKISSGIVTNTEFDYLNNLTGNIQTQIDSKQGTITPGTSAQYYRGDKSWQTLNTDAVPEGTKLYFTQPLVRGTVLAGFVSGAGTITSADTILSAIQKLDGNITAATATQNDYVLRDGSSVITANFTLSNKKIIDLADPTLAQDAATKSYVDSKVGDGISNISNLDATKISSGLVSNTEFDYLNNLTGNIQSQIDSKQPTITAGTSAQYYRGDKTWQTLNTDAVPEGTKLYFTKPLVRGTDLAGFVSGAGTITSADTVLTAIQKLDGNQGNYILRDGSSVITNNLTLSNNKIINLADPTLAQDAATKAYVDLKAGEASQWLDDGSDIYFSSGRVGIGNNDPVMPLHITSTGWGTILAEKVSNTNEGAEIHFSKSRGTVGSLLAVQTGDRLMSLFGSGSYSPTGFTQNVASIEMKAAENFTGSAHGTSIEFGTTGLGTTARLPRMTIAPSGYIGINTTNPQSSLDVKGTLRLSGSTSGYVGLAPAAVAGNTTYTLPSADGTDGHVLKTNGSGVLSWVAPTTTISSLNANQIAAGTVDNTEFGYLDGVTSSIQTQLNSKQGTITAGATTDYYRGDKTWQNFDAAARSALLFGYGISAGTVASGDSIQTAISKVDGNVAVLQANGQWNKSGNDISYSAGSVGVGTGTPHVSSALEISSTSKGFLPPRMTQAQRDAITSPTVGLTIFNLSTFTLQIFDGSNWFSVGQNIPAGAVMAFAASTCPTGWTEYTPAYGRFLRGIDKSGTAIDPAGQRAAGNIQDQDWKGFSMTNTGHNTTAYSHGPVDMGKSTSSFVGNLFTGYWSAGAAATGVRWNAADEIRPKNAAVLYCTYAGTTAPLIPGATMMVEGNTEVSVSDTGTDGTIRLVTEGVEALTVAASGKVGIGTTTPTEKLEVQGSVKATSFVGPGIMKQFKQVAADTLVEVTTATWIDVPDMSITVTTGNAKLLITASGMYRTRDGGQGNIRLVVNGTPVVGTYVNTASNPGVLHESISITWMEVVAPGTHTVKLQWNNQAAAGFFDQGWADERQLKRVLQVIEYSE